MKEREKNHTKLALGILAGELLIAAGFVYFTLQLFVF